MPNLGNVVGLLKGTTAPTKTYVIWAHVLNVSYPDEVVLKVYNNTTASWEPIDSSDSYWLPAVDDFNQTTPPVSPSLGDSYLIASAGATGAWTGKENQLAVWIGHSWKFIVAKEGAVSKKKDDSAISYVFDGTDWEQIDGVDFGGGTTGQVLQFISGSWTKTTGIIGTDGNLAIDLSARRLRKGAGSDTVLDWDLRRAYNSGGTHSLDWENNVLRIGGSLSNRTTLNWGNTTLTTTSITAFVSLNWTTGILSDSNGYSKLDWMNGLIKNSTNFNAINWESSDLFDNEGGISANWSTGDLFLYDGTTSVLNWKNSQLLGNWTSSGKIIFANNQGIDVAVTGGSDVLNIGTSNADVINIGYSSSTVNIMGTLAYQNVTNYTVKDKLITLNKGGSAASAVSAGIEFEENAIITGWFTTDGTRNGFEFKAPAITNKMILDLSLLASSDKTLTVPNRTGTFATTNDMNFTLSTTLNTVNINTKGLIFTDGVNTRWHVGDNLLYDNVNQESADFVNRTLKNSAGAVTLNWSTAANGLVLNNIGAASGFVRLKNTNVSGTINLEFPTTSGTLALTSAIPTVSGTSGQVAYFTGTNTVSSEAAFAYDASTNTLVVDGIFKFPSTGTGIYLYGTVDETTNFERLQIDKSGSNFRFYANQGGTGTVRDIIFQIGTARIFNIRNSADAIGFYNFAGSTGANGCSFASVNTSSTASSGTTNAFSIIPTWFQTGTAAYRGLWISPFESTVGSGLKYLIDAGTNSAINGTGTHTSKFTVDNTGLIKTSSTGSHLFYNTTDETTNWERLNIYWTGNAATIETQIGGTGTIRNMLVGTLNRKLAFLESASVSGIYQFQGATGSPGATLVNTNGTLSASSGTTSVYAVTNRILQTGTAGYRCLWLSPFQDTNGSGVAYLIDAGSNSAANGAGTHTSRFLMDINGTTAIAGSSADIAITKFTVYSTSLIQTRIGYDSSNYFTTQVNSTGNTTFTLTGTSPEFTFANLVRLNSGFSTQATAQNANITIASGSGAGAVTNSNLMIGGASSVRVRMYGRGSTTGTTSVGESYASWLVGSQDVTSAASGTHALFASLAIKPVTITSGGASAITESVTLYIEGAGTGATNNLAVHVAGGISRFDGTLLLSNVNMQLGTSTGTKIGTSVSQLLGFWNATPIVQPLGANQAALTDSTTGTPSFTLADVTASRDQAILNNNFASMARLLNEMRSVLVNTGLMKGSA